MRGVLAPASILYALGWKAYASLYTFGVKRAYRARVPIVCVGNLTVGGAGKTPLVLHLVDVLRGLGCEVIVGASGYGSPRSEAATLAPAGALDPREWGDEPALLREQRPDLPLVVGRRRVLAAQIVEREYPNAVLLMDDGLQHLPLAKSLSIVLEEDSPSNRRTLPAGPYREPRAHRDRFDLRLGGAEENFQIVEFPLVLRRPDDSVGGADSASLLTAIANPERFVRAVEAIGVRLTAKRLLPDHDPLDAPGVLDDLADPIVVTGKDWVKLRLRPDVERRAILIASRELRVEPAIEFARYLQARLEDGTQG